MNSLQNTSVLMRNYKPQPYHFSYIRIFHASPDSPKVNVYIDKKLVVKNINYRNFSDYIKINFGIHSIVLKNPNNDKVLLDTRIEIPPHCILTLAAINPKRNLDIMPILEPRVGPNRFSALLRFSNLAPESPNVDLIANNSTKLFKSVSYKEVEGYRPLKPDTYTFKVKNSKTNENMLYIPNIKLLPNKNYTIYLIGFTNQEPGLQVVIPLDGNSYIKF